MFNLIVLLSGRGSNFAAILRAIQEGSLDARIQAVFSDKRDAPGIAIAEQAGIPVEIIDSFVHPNKSAFDQELLLRLGHYSFDLIVLAGYMRVLTADVIKAYPNKIINIHPSLLPKYPGLYTHARVIENGDKEHGATVHYVTEALDMGPIIAQSALEVLPGDTPDSLAERVLALEHVLYTEVIQRLINRRVD